MDTSASPEREPLRSNAQRCETPSQHVCGPVCRIVPVFGNIWQCSTTGTTHICSSECCRQRVFYDNHHTVCRLSQRLFPNVGGSYHRRACKHSMRVQFSSALQATATVRRLWLNLSLCVSAPLPQLTHFHTCRKAKRMAVVPSGPVAKRACNALQRPLSPCSPVGVYSAFGLPTLSLAPALQQNS